MPLRLCSRLTDANRNPELVELRAGEWALWRSVAVRATGFPVDGLEAFGDDEDGRLARLVENRRFREALTWQNRDVLRNALDRLDSATGSTRRRRLETVASYWQRYCAKNDTIGFFGPLGWGTLVDDGAAAVLEPGAELLAERVTHFEVWAIDALAAALAKDPEVRRWIPPRRHPAFVPDSLDVAEAALFSACDGRPAFEVGSLGLIEKLTERGALVWAFRVPLGPYPETDLRAQLEAIGDAKVRDRCLDSLDRLEVARAGVAAAAGDADALADALGELDRIFESLVNVSAKRCAGEMYAGRTVCYEDCRRDLRLRLGPAVMGEFARALVPVLAGSRWYCGEIYAAGQRLISDALQEVRAERGDARVPLLEVWRRALPRLMPASARREMPTPFEGVAAVTAELQRRWTDLLDGDLDTLSDRACAVFADARSAWPRAVFHGPDVQIAAAGIDALERGEFTVVVGDFHPGGAPVGQSVFLEGNPDPDSVRRFMARHLPEPRLIVVPSRTMGRIGGRFTFGYGTTSDRYLLTTDETCTPSGNRCLNIAELWVDDHDDQAMLVTSEGAVVAPLTHAFEHLIFVSGIRAYQPFAPVPYSPRITTGRTVLRRETWTVPAADMTWVQAKDGVHVAAREWARSLGMPRRVFALADGEPKPVYVDFESRALVSILARFVRAGSGGTVRFSEMLPGPDQSWLLDADGRRYTSELRLTAIDLTRELT
jgi:hypothetical protein